MQPNAMPTQWQQSSSPLKKAIESLIDSVEYPLRVLSDSMMGNGSGASTPRMTISRNSSLSDIPIQEKLDAIKRMEEEMSEPSFANILPASLSFLTGSAKKGGKKIIKVPSDIVWLILTHVARNCKKHGNNGDLLRCCLVDKRYMMHLYWQLYSLKILLHLYSLFVSIENLMK